MGNINRREEINIEKKEQIDISGSKRIDGKKEKKILKKKKFFRIGDLLIYSVLLIVFTTLGLKFFSMEDVKASKAEVYVGGELKYAQKLQKEEKNIFVDTEIGGVDIQFKDNMVRVTTSNSPKKLCVKQGWIKRPGDLIIGVPDKLVIKVLGEGEDELDYVAK